MNEDLVFHMGQFPARFPVDRRYAKNHMWARSDTDAWAFGLSAYAVRLLQDVYFLEWNVDPGTTVRERQPIGFIESSKAESDLYAPLGGEVVEFNGQLLSDPSTINVDPYGHGWLLRIRALGTDLLSPEEYLKHLEGSWLIAQRTIKGQANET
jgi:glycine cleavage system H protein